MLDSFNHAQRERLAFIDFCLEYFGQITRADLIQKFKTGLAAATRDISSYRELAPHNLELSHQTKVYYRTEAFKPVFQHQPESILNNLSKGFGDGISNGVILSDKCFEASTLVTPSSEIIALTMRAIITKSALCCNYTSLTSGESHKMLFPHSIVNNGQRWHVRAFDTKHNEFRDFVCTRLSHCTIDSEAKNDLANAAHDVAWNNLISVELVPHPNLQYPKAIEMDYNMKGGVLKLEVREALLGYVLRYWNVDCSQEASLAGGENHLWLKNIGELAELSCFKIAPGYKECK
ncbi:WYL domain-containing protein [Psychrosphaera sp. 1_MG-2023]|uniref:WYL domain-containing protein n=1 Tax=Psychrosphaera sp. 1_MG-2023 TaxID=3062643 RepID=UPI0026E2D033|nr:WYL domain-containing protein [Psychrosphaera sp. 1_MG-2023]MDO6718708.1 WYL domain-containing protein [Psychrosphaera sp. 1_MG-2023]